MKTINDFIKKNAFLIAISLFIFALLIEAAEFTGALVIEGFSAYTLAMFAFEFILHTILVISLIAKNPKLGNVMMVLIKAFDAVFFVSLICLRIDELKFIETPTHYVWYINFISYAISSILLVVILILFVIYLLKGNHKCWKHMKICMICASIIMFICSIFEIINFIKYSSKWYIFLEPFYMCFLLLGMFVVCHYIESDK